MDFSTMTKRPIPRESALQDFADNLSSGTWRVMFAGEGYPDGERYSVEATANPGCRVASGTAREVRDWLANAATELYEQRLLDALAPFLAAKTDALGSPIYNLEGGQWTMFKLLRRPRISLGRGADMLHVYAVNEGFGWEFSREMVKAEERSHFLTVSGRAATLEAAVQGALTFEPATLQIEGVTFYQAKLPEGPHQHLKWMAFLGLGEVAEVHERCDGALWERRSVASKGFERLFPGGMANVEASREAAMRAAVEAPTRLARACIAYLATFNDPQANLATVVSEALRMGNRAQLRLAEVEAELDKLKARANDAFLATVSFDPPSPASAEGPP